jgi:hypothetical protein
MQNERPMAEKKTVSAIVVRPCTSRWTAPPAQARVIQVIPKETLKNAFRGIFKLASARYTPAPGSVNQALRARFTPGHPAPDGKR